jgi:hypothetical protein
VNRRDALGNPQDELLIAKRDEARLISRRFLW